MRKITEIYKEYKIMPNLAMHQFRVAAVASVLCDSISVSIDKQSVTTACLLHDMGNIIKFNLSKFPEWNEPEGLDYWESVKSDFISRYGSNEHKANVEIVKEMNLPSRIADLVDWVDAESIEDGKNCSDFARKICVYADNRVTPHKIVSIHERNQEAKKRYEDHPHAFDDESSLFYLKNMEEIEKQIFHHANIKPEDITDEVIKEVIDELMNFEI